MIKNKSASKRSSSNRLATAQSDSAYFLKLLLYAIVGSLWLRIESDDAKFGLPIGLAIGLLFATHEHFRVDRKIEFAVLLVAMLVGYAVPTYGLYVSF